MAKMIAPNTTIWWVPLAGLTTPSAPKSTEINAGTNISCAIVTGFTLGAKASDTDTSKTICDEGNVVTPTLGNYEANLTFFRDGVGDTPTVFGAAYTLFKVARVSGWLVSRQGKKAATVAAATDIVSVYKFISDSPRDNAGDKGSPVEFTVPFLSLGEFYINVSAVA